MLTRERTPDQAAAYEEGYNDGFADAVDDVTPDLIEAAKTFLARRLSRKARMALEVALAVAEGKR